MQRCALYPERPRSARLIPERLRERICDSNALNVRHRIGKGCRERMCRLLISGHDMLLHYCTHRFCPPRAPISMICSSPFFVNCRSARV
jgi:hypothetical protein